MINSMYDPLDYLGQHEPRKRKTWKQRIGRRIIFFPLFFAVLIPCVLWGVANPSTEAQIRDSSFILLEIGAVLLAIFALGMLLIWLSSPNPHLKIHPFDSAIEADKSLGIPIAYSLTAQLQRIAYIHSITIPGIESEQLGPVAPDSPGTEQLQDIISNALTVGIGTTTVSIGRIFIMLKELWPFSASDTVLTGSIHRYGSWLLIAAHLKSHQMYAWEVGKVSQDYDCLPDMIEDLSFQIARDISEKTIKAQTWEGLKYLTKARYHCFWYIQTDKHEHLTRAADYCFQALPLEKSNAMLSDLLNKVGALYALKDNYSESEKIFREVTKLRSTKDEQNRSFLGLGHALIGLHRYDEAVEAYESVIMNGEGLALAVAWDYSAVAYTTMAQYDKAIECLNKATDLYSSYLRQHKFENKEKFMIQENIKLAHSSLALCFWKKAEIEGKVGNTGMESFFLEEHTRHIREARDILVEVNNYNQACLEAIDGNCAVAVDYLQKVLEAEGSAPIDFLLHDCDFDRIRNCPEFKALIAKY